MLKSGYKYFQNKCAKAHLCFNLLNAVLLLAILFGGLRSASARSHILRDINASGENEAVWQWSVAVDGQLDHHPDARAYLWIPPDCKRIRGVVVAQHNMEEISILENPIFRKEMAKLGFAEIWVAPSFDHLFRFNAGAVQIFDKMITGLTEVSGYSSLQYAPVVPIGHSAAASWPYYFAVAEPGRTLAAISVSGQWPYFRSPVFAPDIWKENQSMDHIPALETMGEYENGESWASEGLRQRAAHPAMPLSMLTCPAEGHFAASDKKVAYLALYIRKAVAYRFPEKYPANAYPVLKPIDPAVHGWLVPRWRRDKGPQVAAAPVKLYKGDPGEAFWFFDKQMALATMAYQAGESGKSPQSLAYEQEGKVVQQRETHQQVDLRFLPKSSGIDFSLKAVFSDTVPGGSHFPASWAERPAGSRLGHSRNGQPILIERICGPFIKTGENNFSIRFSRETTAFTTDKHACELWFLAFHPGSGYYKPAILQAVMHIPVRNKSGAQQKIDFPPIPDQDGEVTTLALHAASSAGLPVHFYIREGPAFLKGSTLVFTKIPANARLPIKVTVVAWQYGRAQPGSQPVQTAPPVLRTFYIRGHKPI